MTEKASPKTLTAHQIVIEFYNPGDFKEHQKFKNSEWVRVEDCEAEIQSQERFHRKVLEQEQADKKQLTEENAKLTKDIELQNQFNRDYDAQISVIDTLEGKLQTAQQILTEFSNLYPTQKHVEMDKWLERLKAALK